MATVASDPPLEDTGAAENNTDDVGEEYSPHLEETLGGKGARKAKSLTPVSKDTSSKNTVPCKVYLPNGEIANLTVDRKIKGGDLVERIHTEIDISEKDYFSLYFIDNNQKIFIDSYKQVRDQVPSAMKGQWVLKYGVKFYVADPSILKEDISRYQYCLQLCQDIKDNRVLVDKETATRLTALMIQASVGDYDVTECQPGYTDAFSDFVLLPRDELPSNYESQIMEVHKAKAGYSPAQAESEFLQIAKKLSRYGMHLFVAKTRDGSIVLIGFSYKGVSIYQDHIETARYDWPNINKIAYKRRKLIVKYRKKDLYDSRDDLATGNTLPMDSKGSGQIHVTKLYTGEPPSSKRMWKTAVEQHTFFRLNVPDRPSRITQVLRRGTKFRYSGRTFRQVRDAETLRNEPKFTRTHSERLRTNPRKDFAPGYVPARNSFKSKKKPVATRHFEVGQQIPYQDWVTLDAPAHIDPNKADYNNYEEQNVHVKFRLKTDDELDSPHRFVITKGSADKKGTIERVGPKSSSGTNEDCDFYLAPIDPLSRSAVTRVSVKLNEKPEDVRLTKNRKVNGCVLIYDSTKIPDVKLNKRGLCDKNIEDVTMSYAVHSKGDQPTAVGALLYQYRESESKPLKFRAPTDEEDEAAQVQQFLQREAEIMEKAIATAAAENVS